MQKEESNTKKPLFKKIIIDCIKFLFLLLILSLFFHSKISSFISAISDYAFHHYFFTIFLSLICLVITLEFEIFNGEHSKEIKNKIKNNLKK
jgi:hypothetical protein